MAQHLLSFKTSGAHHIMHVQHKSNVMSDWYELLLTTQLTACSFCTWYIVEDCTLYMRLYNLSCVLEGLFEPRWCHCDGRQHGATCWDKWICLRATSGPRVTWLGVVLPPPTIYIFYSACLLDFVLGCQIILREYIFYHIGGKDDTTVPCCSWHVSGFVVAAWTAAFM